MTNLLQRFQDIDDRTEELRDLADTHGDLWRDFLGKFELSWIYHENALEGIVLTHAALTSAGGLGAGLAGMIVWAALAVVVTIIAGARRRTAKPSTLLQPAPALA